jgi:hypothetical protein
MGSKGGDAPTGLKQVQLRTVFLRAPFQDWAALSQGHKTEFRVLPRGVPSKWIEAPTPVVLYALSPHLGRRSEKLMVIIEHQQERLADIHEKPESIRREGFETYDQFRRYWRARTGRPYRPLDKVEVFQLQQWTNHNWGQLGERLLERLYGEYMPNGQ